jgi:D-alanyl-D-alanine carboxypeptidase
MVGTAAAGRVRAKTGTLDDVIALSGLVAPPASAAGLAAPLDQPLAFSIILNHVPSIAEGQQVVDKLAVTLTTFPQAPALAGLVPEG